MPVEITSRQNPVVRDCRQLARARDGDRVLLDGAHLLAEALDEDVAIESAIASHDFAARHQALLAALGRRTNVYLAADGVLQAASPVRTPSGIVGIASLPLSPVSDTLGQQAAGASAFRAAMAVALVDVQDPGNAGAVVRSVEAAGGTGVIACGSTADPFGWKALRASMGSAFRVPVARAALDQVFSDAKVAGVRVIAATVEAASADMRDIRWNEPFVLLVGNEGRGLPADAAARAELRVRIPMYGRLQSMNAAVSAAVILYEAQRQRD
jgi:RNA methyltransferase, TrmH family